MRWTILAAALVMPASALAQDALTPPPNLGAQGVPVPPDGTAIYGGAPPAGYMAIPVPPSTCGPLQAMVQRNGFVLIPIGGGNAQRYVRDQSLCQEDQVGTPAWVPTDDNPRCFIGYTCDEADNDGGN